MEKLKALLAEYGSLAITIYFVIFGVVFAGFAIAISAGFEPEGAAGNAGTIGAAWLATKLTQPLRIGATLLLTPIVAKLRPQRPQPTKKETTAESPEPDTRRTDPSASGRE